MRCSCLLRTLFLYSQLLTKFLTMPNKPPSLIKIGLACLIGNSIEVYDFALFGILAPILGKLFFLEEDPTAQLLSTFAIFAIGFIMRPIGGILFGHIGDRLGRKRALLYSLTLMTGPSFLIGLLPTYTTIGLAAPLLLILMRLLQGISLGGEYVGALTYMLEHAPAKKKILYSAWPYSGGAIGILFATLTGAAVSSLFTNDMLLAGAWRLPFLLGVIPALIGFRLRRYLRESPEFLAIPKASSKTTLPLVEAFKIHWPTILAYAGMIVPSTVSTYIMFIFLPAYLNLERGFPYAQILMCNFLSIILSLILTPLTGIMADRIGWTKPYLFGMGGILIVAIPFFMVLADGQIWHIIIAQMVATSLLMTGAVAVPALMWEAFPTAVRYTAAALSYNIATSFFGGMTPLICTLLISLYGPIAPSYWLCGCATLGCLGALGMMRLLSGTRHTHHSTQSSDPLI